MIIFPHLCIPIAFVCAVESIILLFMTPPTASAAFNLQKIQWENRGFDVEVLGYGAILLHDKPKQAENV